jgi:hypothetical protein
LFVISKLHRTLHIRTPRFSIGGIRERISLRHFIGRNFFFVDYLNGIGHARRLTLFLPSAP